LDPDWQWARARRWRGALVRDDTTRPVSIERLERAAEREARLARASRPVYPAVPTRSMHQAPPRSIALVSAGCSTTIWPRWVHRKFS